MYLNEGKGSAIRDSIGADMIESLRHHRYNPGTELKPIKYPNAMYYIPNWIFAVAIQLCVPVIIIGAVFTLSITISNWSPYRGFMNVWMVDGCCCRSSTPMASLSILPREKKVD